MQSHILLTQAIDILNPIHHQDMTVGQLMKYLHYERLLIDLYEAISRQTFLDGDNNLLENCQSFLMENHSENGKENIYEYKKRIIFDIFRSSSGTCTCCISLYIISK